MFDEVDCVIVVERWLRVGGGDVISRLTEFALALNKYKYECDATCDISDNRVGKVDGLGTDSPRTMGHITEKTEKLQQDNTNDTDSSALRLLTWNIRYDWMNRPAPSKSVRSQSVNPPFRSN